MSRREFRKFEWFCEDNGVELPPLVDTDFDMDRATERRTTGGDIYVCDYTTVWPEAVAAAGAALRRDPSVKLVNSPIPNELIDENDLVQVALWRILNASLNRESGDGVVPAFTCGPVRPIDCCSAADGGFARTVQACGGSDNGLNWRIIVDDNNPIAITKKSGVQSTLSLVPILINGVPYPEGSILRIGLARRIEGEGPKKKDLRVTVPIEEVSRVGFPRLSAIAVFEEWRMPAVRDAVKSALSLSEPAKFVTESDPLS